VGNHHDEHQANHHAHGISIQMNLIMNMGMISHLPQIMKPALGMSIPVTITATNTDMMSYITAAAIIPLFLAG
jgi:hypothetical protein